MTDVGRLMEDRVSDLEDRVSDLEESEQRHDLILDGRLRATAYGLGLVHSDTQALRSELAGFRLDVDRRFDQVDQRFEDVNRRFDQLGQNVTEILARLSADRSD